MSNDSKFITIGNNRIPVRDAILANDRMDKLKSELAAITGSQEMALKIFEAIKYGRLTGVTVL